MLRISVLHPMDRLSGRMHDGFADARKFLDDSSKVISATYDFVKNADETG
jgi:hypothetical protein